eukprot:CAMPEP_0176110358 /NCGR_PEP_ID=MMETSP0120_2-20121206/55415_1 /TAXON_ID=160619 /ORGANISM="Kryptoperidinium foliaceum, Strain CCMP 1326" /LENGTH=64 /DNA_ID=CAMNT_0017444563 /DNA_START=331 /DNA_END=525 /DNA_ORIENTATION=+
MAPPLAFAATKGKGDEPVDTRMTWQAQAREHDQEVPGTGTLPREYPCSTKLQDLTLEQQKSWKC